MKRFATPALSIATTLLALSGSALVYGQAQSPQLMSGYAELNHTIDSKSAMVGQVVSAKLTGTIETPEGLKLPGGTQLLGHIDQVQASGKNGEARLELTFDKAQLKNGQQVPIKATLIEVNTSDVVGELPHPVASDNKFDQQTTVSGQFLHSAVQDQDSGTLVRKDKDIRLTDGTKMLIAVAPASAVGGANNGS
jgi:hypothetical protein